MSGANWQCTQVLGLQLKGFKFSLKLKDLKFGFRLKGFKFGLKCLALVVVDCGLVVDCGFV